MAEIREWIRPEEIERRSMEIIEREMPAGQWTLEELAVVKRCIHTSADLIMRPICIFPKERSKRG